MGIACDRRAVTDWILRYIKTTFFLQVKIKGMCTMILKSYLRGGK